MKQPFCDQQVISNLGLTKKQYNELLYRFLMEGVVNKMDKIKCLLDQGNLVVTRGHIADLSSQAKHVGVCNLEGACSLVIACIDYKTSNKIFYDYYQLLVESCLQLCQHTAKLKV